MGNIGVIGAGSWGTALALLLDKEWACSDRMVAQTGGSGRTKQNQRT